MVDDERDGVRLTSLDSPLGDGLDVTKGDLVDYLDAFADRLVPQLAGRPLTIKRVRPGAEPFMQKNVMKGAPDWVRTVTVWSEAAHREVHQVLCDDRRTLLWLANQRSVEFHVPFFRLDDPAHPTALVLDLDPPEGADFPAVVAVARLVRGALDGAGLAGAVKTSGAKGLHVVVPVRDAAVEDVAAATRALAARTEALDPAHRDHRVPQGGAGREGLRRLHAGGPGNGRRRLQPTGPPGAAGLGAGDLGRAGRRPPRGRHRTDGGGAARGRRPLDVRPARAAAAPRRSGRRGTHHPDRPCRGHARRQAAQAGGRAVRRGLIRHLR